MTPDTHIYIQDICLWLGMANHLEHVLVLNFMKSGNFPVSSGIAAPCSNFYIVLLMLFSCNLMHMYRVAC